MSDLAEAQPITTQVLHILGRLPGPLPVVTVDEVVASDDLVAVAWTAEGTNLGEFYGIPATGRTAQWEGLDLMRFTCGKISEVWVSADALGLHMQLGAITEEERISVGTPTP